MKNHLLLFVLGFFPGIVLAQDYIYISRSGVRDLFRVNLAYTNFSINPDDSATHTANGVHLLNEVKIVSALWNEDWGVTAHDAFYFDIGMGSMSNTPRTIAPDDVGNEHKFSLSSNFGYLLLMGYRQPRWAALGGIDFRWNTTNIGMYKMSPVADALFIYTRPFVFRGELCISKDIADKRIIGMFWVDGGTTSRPKYTSARLEIPLGNKGRWWLFGQATQMEGMVNDEFYPGKSYNATMLQYNIGFRIQNAIL